MEVTDTEEPRIEGFICMSQEMRWGWGATPEDAVKRARKANGGTGARKGKRLIYRLPTGAVDAFVDQMGRITWTWLDTTPDRMAVGEYIEEPKQ
jgi:hypothetical protein